MPSGTDLPLNLEILAAYWFSVRSKIRPLPTCNANAWRLALNASEYTLIAVPHR